MAVSERKTPESCLYEIIHGTKELLTWYKDMGMENLDLSENSLKTISSWSYDGKRQPFRQETFSPKASATPSPPESSRVHRKKAFPEQMLNFQGPDNSKIIFVLDVEAPSGKKIDVYEGPAGELLSRIFTAINLDRDSVKTCFFPRMNDVKEKRTFFQNINALREFLRQHIIKSSHEMICTMGETALQLLADKNFQKARGRFHDYNGTPVMPTLHPVELIKDPSLKRYVWEDLQKIMKQVGL